VNLLLSLLTVPLLYGAVVLTLQIYSPVPPLLSEAEGRVFLFLGVPLHIGGSFIGLKYLANPNFPCKVSTVQPPTRSPKRWFQHPLAIILLSGYLPIYLIQWTIFALLNNLTEYRPFCIYGFGLAAFLQQLGMSACCGLLVTYHLLTLEDHRWPWVSFLSAGSSAGYMLLLVANRFRMSGWLPWSIYMGYLGLAGFGCFLVFGSIGHFAADYFLRYVYAHLKRI